MRVKRTFCDWVYDGSPMLKVLSWFFTQDGLDYDKSSIVRCARVDRHMLNDYMVLLEEAGVIKQTRSIGTSKMYGLAVTRSELSNIIRIKCKCVWSP